MNNSFANKIKSLIEKGTKGATFAHMTTQTEGKSFMNKRNNPFFETVVKQSTINICLGFDYQGAIDRLVQKENKEEREAKPRKWGVVTEDKLFVEHKGEYYLRARVMGNITKPVYLNRETGEVIDKEMIEPFLKKSSPKSSTQSDLEGEVIERDYKISSILTLKTNKVTLVNNREIEDFSELVRETVS